METKISVLETNFDDLELYGLDENEAMDTDGGGHYEIIDGVLTLVED